MAQVPKERPSSSRPEPHHRPSQRLPAPSLFVGPPSRNASNTSLLLSSGTQTSSTGPASSTALQSPSNLSSPPPFPARQRSYLDRLYPETANLTTKPSLSHSQTSFLREHGLEPAHSTGATAAGTGPGTKDAAAAATKPTKQKLDSKEVTEAHWREMQNTLEEVELSATSGVHVFGAAHAEALERLRTAQVELAQAWARGEGEEVVDGLGEGAKGAKGMVAREGVGDSPQSKTGGGGGRERGGSAGSQGAQGGRSQLEEEAEADIVLARRRREANDRYFQRVNAGVLDVVAKLDEVAEAMKGVEMESKEIWGDRDSIETGSVMS